MGQIQSGINQLFTTAGVMARLNPELSAKAENRAKLANLKIQEVAATEARDTATNIIDQEQYQKDIQGIKKQIFEADPTKSNYEAYQKANPVQGTVTTEADPEEIAMERAEEAAKEQEVQERVQQLLTPYKPEEVMSKMAEKGKAKVEQRAKRRDFMKALGAEQVNFGSGTEGSVSDLPKNLQKAIAAQYNKSQRKELMNKYYGEK